MEQVGVLLVEDHPVVREGVRRLLEMDPRILVVGEVESGEDASAAVAGTGAVVVLMDLKLPGMDGVEATRQLMAQFPRLRVVMFSSFGDHNLTAAIQAGACGYILKTATQPELALAVLKAFAGHSPIDASLSNLLVTRLMMMSKEAHPHGLSARQLEMLKMIAGGLSTRDIQDRLFISPATVKREFRNIFNVLGVNDRAQAVAEAYNRHLM